MAKTHFLVPAVGFVRVTTIRAVVVLAQNAKPGSEIGD